MRVARYLMRGSDIASFTFAMGFYLSTRRSIPHGTKP